MWCKIMENVESPEKIYEIRVDPSLPEEGIYYSAANGAGATIEVTKYLAPGSEMEAFTMSSFKKEMQVQLFVGEEVAKVVLATVDRYLFFELNGKAVERLQLIVTAVL